MQGIYALTQSHDESLQKQEKFLKVSIENMYTLYLTMLSLLAELHRYAENREELAAKRYLTDTGAVTYPNKDKFIQNKVLLQLANNAALIEEMELRKLSPWYLNEEYVKIIYNEVVNSPLYATYMVKPNSTYAEDKQFVLTMFKEIVAPNEKVYDYFEDDKLTWVDDIPTVNTFILKSLKKVTEGELESYFLPSLLKDEEDLIYAKRLLTKTLLNDSALSKEIEGKTPNWDNDRIAEIDMILMKMAITELLHFPSIPERVTINEYLEIAKEYSTPKSSIFINGILDKLTKEFKEEGKLKKMGRGLL